jgi:hypothetical protein
VVLLRCVPPSRAVQSAVEKLIFAGHAHYVERAFDCAISRGSTSPQVARTASTTGAHVGKR